jgi:hypothetical protein
VAQGPLTSGADVVILLSDQLRGQRIRCRVTGYSAGSAIRRGEAQVDVVGGSVVDLPIALTTTVVEADGGGPMPDAGAADGGPRDTAGPDIADALPGPRGNGQKCNVAAECGSGHCADGVCCDVACTGTCRACNLAGRVGTCATVAAGTADSRCQKQSPATCSFDGTCDASGACRKYPASTPCAAGTCSGNTVSGGGACDGNGVCVMGGSVSCGEYTCNPSTGSCRTTCTSNGDCVSPNSCSSKGQCGTLKPLGQTCGGGGECASGNCADGVCCSVATCGACFTCDVPGSAGKCQPVASGDAEPHGLCPVQPVAMCGLNGTCNGRGSCASYPDGTMCRVGRFCLNGACR